MNATGRLAPESNFTLALLCSKCTRAHRIGGSTPEQCYQGADILGWVVDKDAGTAICPKCPAFRSVKAA